MKNLKTLILTTALALAAASTLSAQAIVGAWTFGNTSSPGATNTGIFVFLDNGVFFQAEDVNDGGGGSDGMERGTYSWNSGTNVLTINTVPTDTNGDVGVGDLAGGGTINDVDASGNTMDVGGTTFTRVTGASDIVGGWYFGDTLNPGSVNTGVLVYLSNGVYFHAEESNDGELNTSSGMERGTYTWNSGDGTMTWSTAVDTNGELGMSDIYSGIEVSISGNDLSAINTDGDGIGTFSATRVSAVPEPSTYAVIAGVLCLGIAALRRRKQS